MASSNLNLQFTIKELLAGAEKLNTKDLEKFFENLLHLRAKRRSPHVPNQEAELLEKINNPLTVELQNRFDELRIKRDDGSVSKEEHAELLSIINIIENKEAERVGYIGKLAELRNVPVTEVLISLGIQPPPDA